MQTMVAIFYLFGNNKNNAFLYYFKMLNLGQSGFSYLKGDQIKNIAKYSKANLVDPYHE